MMRDVLDRVFDIPAEDFHARFAGRRPRVRHGAVERFDRLLGPARPRGEAGLAALIDDYAGIIETTRFDRRGILRRLTVRGSAYGKMLVRPERCHFLYDYDARYRSVRLLLKALRTALGTREKGASGRGTLHTAGARVPRHSDAVDVIALQVLGTRRWRIEPNSDPPLGLLDPVRWPKRLTGGWSSEFGAKSRTVVMRPGTALYVPYGWWHETQSPETSFALTFSFERERY